MSDNEELEAFVRSACISIQKGLAEGLQLRDTIDFEVAVVNQWKAGIGIKMFIVGASTKYKQEEITKIKFKISPKGYLYSKVQ